MFIFLPFCLLIVAVIVGGIDMMTQALQLAKKPHFIVGEYSYYHTNLPQIKKS